MRFGPPVCPSDCGRYNPEFTDKNKNLNDKKLKLFGGEEASEHRIQNCLSIILGYNKRETEFVTRDSTAVNEEGWTLLSTATSYNPSIFYVKPNPTLDTPPDVVQGAIPIHLFRRPINSLVGNFNNFISTPIFYLEQIGI